MAKNTRRRSWFSPKLPLGLLQSGKPEPAKPRNKSARLRVESLEDRTVPAVGVLLNDPTWLNQSGVTTGSPSLTQGSSAAFNNQSGGTITALATPYGTASTIFAGASNGGVWRTTDNGTTWTPLTDAMPSNSITKIAINPFDTGKVLVGLGATSAGGADGYSLPSGDLLGVYYSTNANAAPSLVRWKILGGVLAGTTITGVVARDNYLLVTNQNGLYRSTDDGNTFSLISGTNGLPAGAVFDLAEVPPPRVPPLVLTEPTKPDEFYVVTRSGVFRSLNGGATWANMNVTFNNNDGVAVSLANAVNAKIAVHFDVFDHVVYVGMVNPNPLRPGSAPAALPLQAGIPSATQETHISWINLALANPVWTAMDQPRQLSAIRGSLLIPATTSTNAAAGAAGITGTVGGPITVNLTAHGLQTGDVVRLTQLYPNAAASVTQAIGLWQVVVVTANQFQLFGSTVPAAGLAAYTGDILLSKPIPYQVGGNTAGVDPTTLGMTSTTGGILVSLAGHGFVTGDRVRVTGIPRGGPTPDVDNANGDWQVQVVNSAQFILLNATFNGTYGGDQTAPIALGFIQKWIDPTYGSTGALNFALAADNYDPNVIYVGGDFTDRGTSSFTVAGAGAANNVSSNSAAAAGANIGNLVRGNRLLPRAINPYKYNYLAYTPIGQTPNTPEWAPMTNGTAFNTTVSGVNPTAPRGGSRVLVMDANYGIVLGTEGGLFRWTKPPIGGNPNPQSGVGYWSSLNQGLNVEEVYNVGLDRLNNTIIAGTNTNGTVTTSGPRQIPATSSGGLAGITGAVGGPITVNYTAHGLVTGDVIQLAGGAAPSVTQAIGFFTVTVVNADQFVLSNLNGTPTVVPAAGLATYTGDIAMAKAYTATRLNTIGAIGGTAGNPISVTFNAHGFLTGDTVRIAGTATTSVPQAVGTFTITVTGANTFTLNGTNVPVGGLPLYANDMTMFRIIRTIPLTNGAPALVGVTGVATGLVTVNLSAHGLLTGDTVQLVSTGANASVPQAIGTFTITVINTNQFVLNGTSVPAAGLPAYTGDILIFRPSQINANLNTGTNRGQGYQVQIDNTNPLQTIRYSVGNNAFNTTAGGPLQRQLVGNNGTQTAATLTTTTTQTNFNPVALNNVANNRFLVGGTSTSSPTGASGLNEVTINVATGAASSVINVTPPNMFSQPSQVLAIAYGGKNPDGTLVPEAAYFGTSNGQIYARGQGENAFFPKLPPSLNRVTGIVMDPNNWRIAYAVRGADVIKTVDGGNTWATITDNLKSAPPPTASLTTELRSIALWVDSADPTNQRLLVGGRGGYFRRDPSLPNGNATWSRYGSQLPYVIGQDLKFYGDKLVAGTFGRGVWTVENVKPTITAPVNLQVTGTAGDDLIYVFQDPNLPNNVIVKISTNGGPFDQTSYDRAVFQTMTINSGIGNDTVIIDSNAELAGGDTSFVNFQIAVDAGGDSGDRLIVNNGAGTTSTTYSLAAAQISAPTGETLFGSAGYITYSGLAAGGILLNDSGLNDTVTVNGYSSANLTINDTAGTDNLTVNGSPGNFVYFGGTGSDLYQINNNAGTMQIFGGSANNGLAIRTNSGTINYTGSTANDTIYISSSAIATLVPLTPTGALGSNTGTINIIGNGGTNLLNATDFFNVAGSIGTITATSMTGFGMGAGAINFTGITTLNFIGSANPAAGDLVLVTGTGNATTTNLSLGQGDDTVNIQAVGAGTTLNVDTGVGVNVTNVSSDAGTNAGILSGIQGLLNVAGGGTDTLNVSDFGNASGSTGTVTGTAITGFGMGGSINYATIPTLNVSTSNTAAAADLVTVLSTNAGTTTLLLLNDGNDAANIVANAGPLTVRGGLGNDTITAGSTNLLSGIQGALAVDGEAGTNTLNISDSASAGGIGTLTPTAFTGLGMGASGIAYSNFAALNLSTSNTSTDIVTVTNTMAGTTNINTNGGIDTINIRAVTGPLNVNAGLGADFANVSSDAAANLGVLSGIQGALFLDGGDAGTNTLNVSDFGAGSSTGTIGNGNITGFGMGPGGISHIRWTPVNITFGSVGPNNITIVGTTPGVTTVINGSNGNDIFNVRATDATGNLVINGLGGNDTVNVSSDAPLNTGNLAGIQGSVSFDGGIGSNTLNVSDFGNLGASVGTIAGGTITGFGMGAGGVTATANVQFINIDSANNLINGDSITVTNTFATGLTTLRLNGGNDAVTVQNSSGNFNILGGDGNDTIAIQRNTSGTINAGGGLGNDTFYVSGSATSAGVGAAGTLSGIAAPVILNGDQGTNTVGFGDLGNATGSVGSINAALVTGFGMGVSGVAYTNFSSFNFDSSNVAAASDAVTIVNTMAGTSVVRLNDGNDTANVQGVTGPLVVNAGVGNDTINVSSAAGTLAGIQGLLNVDGGTGSNTLNASNFGATTNLSGTLASTAITGFGMVASGIAFTNIGVLGFSGSNTGNDLINVASTIAGTTNVLGNGGNDTFTIQGDGLGGANTLDGGAGDDLFTVNTGSGIGAGSVQLVGGANSGGGSDRALFNGRVGGADAFAMTLASANNAMGGLGTTIGFNTIEGVTADGLGGADNFSVGDNTNTSYGTVLAPETGVVYRPTGATAGDIRFNMNPSTGVSNTLSVTPDTNFRNIPGSFLYNGDVDGSGDRDVLTVLGVSQTGSQSTGVYKETTAASGVDTINATDSLVTISNATLGALHGVALQPTTVSSLFVRGGNETGAGGDIVTGTPSTKLFLYLDGQNPAFTTPGDRLSVPTVGTSTNTPVTDPNLGPAHRRITDGATGGTVDFINFESINGSSATGSPQIIAAGSDAGTPSRVRVFNAATGALIKEFNPYPGFTGGTRVAVGDVNGDGVQDIVTSVGPGGGPHIQVFSGVDYSRIYSYYAYLPGMSLGVTVSTFDLNQDGKADIITGVGPGGGPHVTVWSGADLSLLRSFYAYDPSFTGGVNSGAGDVDGDGIPDIVTVPVSGGGPHVKVFRYSDMAVTRSFYGYDPAYTGGMNLAVGDINGDFAADIVLGTNAGSTSALVLAWDVKTATPNKMAQFYANTGSSTRSGQIVLEAPVRVGVTDMNSDGVNDIVVARGAGTAPRIRSFKVNPGSLEGVQGAGIDAFEPTYGFGVWLGAK